MVSSPKLRKLWRQHGDEQDRRWAEYDRKAAEWLETAERISASGNYSVPLPAYPEYPNAEPIPVELHELTCGAKTRAGTPCKRTDLYRSGRCKFHGGLSTGPRSLQGKKKVSLNGKRSKAHEGLSNVKVTTPTNGQVNEYESNDSRPTG